MLQTFIFRYIPKNALIVKSVSSKDELLRQEQTLKPVTSIEMKVEADTFEEAEEYFNQFLRKDFEKTVELEYNGG